MIAKNYLVSHKKAKIIRLSNRTCILLTDSFLQVFSFKAIHIPPKVGFVYLKSLSTKIVEKERFVKLFNDEQKAVVL